MNTKTDTKLSKSVFLIIIILFGAFLAYSLWEYFTAFLGSILFYVLFKRRMEYLIKQKKWKRSRAAILLMLASFFIILIPTFLFITLVLNKIIPVASNPDIFLPYIHQVESILQEKFGIELLTNENLSYVKAIGATVVSSILNQGFSFFSTIVMMYFFLYFMLINVNRIEASMVILLPFRKDKIKMLGEELKTQTFSNAFGIPLIAVAQGLLSYIIYIITGVPEAGFWAVLTGLASVIPIVGTGIIWLPISIYFFVIGSNWQGVVVIIWCALIMGSMDNVIRFLLAKRMADVHPIVTVLGLLVGVKYLGITGLIFGPLLISYFLILLKIYYSDYQKGNYKHKVKEPSLQIGVPFIYQKTINPKNKQS